ncbi:MAG TPA: hypothetical protein VGK39_06735 [Cyclobacteriaceae bacterium]
MKKIIAFLLLAVGISAFQCEDGQAILSEESSLCSDLNWLKTVIQNAQQNSSKAEVIRYHYKLQTVYYINTCINCADSMAQVYTCSGEVICQFGGIAGLNTCPDFNDTATGKKVIWKN